ncbi:hypothetical protein KC347_g2650 [Hortaea werneckii]|nr:hypothetical protein KC347_g2650 [Hortaea werneckii]
MGSNTIRRLEQHPYVSLQSIGSGGQGSVDLVEDKHHQRFARKTVRGLGGVSKEEALQVISNEVNIARRLESRHIIRILDAYYIQDYTRPYADCAFIMDQIATCNLAQLLSQPDKCSQLFTSSPDPETQTPQSFLRKGLGCMTATLVHAHTNGVRHKDIKPENILIWVDESRQPRLLLTDFGLARDLAFRGDADLASHTFNAGTWRYAPPEFFSNATRDTRSDIFSLGFICHSFFGYRESNAKLRVALNSLRNSPFFGELAMLVRSMLHPEKTERPYAAQVQQTLRTISSKDLFCTHCRALHAQQHGTNDKEEKHENETHVHESDGSESGESESSENESNESESDGDDGERMRRFFRNNPAWVSYVMAQPQFIALRQMHERNGTDLYGDRRLHDLVIRLRR